MLTAAQIEFVIEALEFQLSDAVMDMAKERQLANLVIHLRHVLPYKVASEELTAKEKQEERSGN